MASVSSHILDSVSGKSAVGIRSRLYLLSTDEQRQLLFDVTADQEGRIAETVVIDDSNRGRDFELVFSAAEYFAGQSLGVASMVREVVIRFSMQEDKRYHLPVMLSPHSYSTWWSS